MTDQAALLAQLTTHFKRVKYGEQMKSKNEMIKERSEAAATIRSMQETIEMLTKERDEAEAADEAITAKLNNLLASLRPGAEVPTCGCSYDHKSDVCLHHSPQLTAASRRVAVLEEALKMLRGFGCPVCSGDCGSANPPVMFCPMQEISAFLKDTPS